jgi:hypothetical protein
MPRRLSNQETRKLADDLAGLLDRIQAGELDASIAMTYRVEGALTALQAVLGERHSVLADFDRLTD